MRIVALADTHMYHQDLSDIPEADILIHAGDLLRNGSLDELAKAARWLSALPHPHKLLVAGNHDLCFQRTLPQARALLPDDVIYLQDNAVTIGGLTFWGSPWLPQFHDWAFMLERGLPLRRKWDLIPPNTDILITHGPPKGFGDRVTDGLRVGCEELLQAVKRIKPMVHLYGHIHQDAGVWREAGTAFVNVTCWECELPPTLITIDRPLVTVSNR